MPAKREMNMGLLGGGNSGSEIDIAAEELDDLLRQVKSGIDGLSGMCESCGPRLCRPRGSPPAAPAAARSSKESEQGHAARGLQRRARNVSRPRGGARTAERAPALPVSVAAGGERSTKLKNLKSSMTHAAGAPIWDSPPPRCVFGDLSVARPSAELSPPLAGKWRET